MYTAENGVCDMHTSVMCEHFISVGIQWQTESILFSAQSLFKFDSSLYYWQHPILTDRNGMSMWQHPILTDRNGMSMWQHPMLTDRNGMSMWQHPMLTDRNGMSMWHSQIGMVCPCGTHIGMVCPCGTHR